MTRRKILKPLTERVYKVCTAREWQAALARGRYDGSSDDLRDGFVHLSTAAQLPGVLQRHFKHAADLMVIGLPSLALGPKLKWEENGADTFPHFYGSLPAELALAVHKLPADEGARAKLLSTLS